MAIYAPTTASDDEEVERFYEKLKGVFQRKSTSTVMLGDFIVKLGTRGRYIGNLGIGKRNGRGRRLADFAESGKLYAMNSFFNKRLGRRWI